MWRGVGVHVHVRGRVYTCTRVGWQGTDAMAREMFLFFRAPFPWGVNVDHILDTPCWWWSGSDDRNCDGESGVVASKNQLRPMRRLVVKVRRVVGGRAGADAVRCGELQRDSPPPWCRVLWRRCLRTKATWDLCCSTRTKSWRCSRAPCSADRSLALASDCNACSSQAMVSRPMCALLHLAMVLMPWRMHVDVDSRTKLTWHGRPVATLALHQPP